MVVTKLKVQLAAIILVCVVIIVAIMPSQVTGVIDDSIMKFIKVFGMAIQGLIFGSFSNDGGGDE